MLIVFQKPSFGKSKLPTSNLFEIRELRLVYNLSLELQFQFNFLQKSSIGIVFNNSSVHDLMQAIGLLRINFRTDNKKFLKDSITDLIVSVNTNTCKNFETNDEPGAPFRKVTPLDVKYYDYYYLVTSMPQPGRSLLSYQPLTLGIFVSSLTCFSPKHRAVSGIRFCIWPRIHTKYTTGFEQLRLPKLFM